MTAVSASLTKCTHCGTPFFPSNGEGEFCCSGCRFVYHWIAEEGLERFYDLKGQTVTEAVGNAVFEPADLTWAERLQARAEADAEGEGEGDVAAMEFGLEGMSCIACAWLIERRFERSEGGVRIDVYPERGTARMTWEPGSFSAAELFKDLAHFGYRATESGAPLARSGAGDGLATRLGVCGAFALNTMAFTLPRYFGLGAESDLGVLFALIAFVSATLAVVAGGSFFFVHAWKAMREGILHIDLPIALGIAAAYLGSVAGWVGKIDSLFYVDFVATFVFLMLLGRWIQQRALASAQRRLGEGSGDFLGTLEREAEGGGFEAVIPDQIRKDDRLLLRPGAVVPIEGTVEGNPITISLEWITGEPDAMPLKPGQTVPAGARILSRDPARIRARQTFADGILSKLISQRQAPRDRLLERVLRIYLVVVLAIALLGGAFWVVASGTAVALQVFISVLVVSCPCALGVAIPLVDAWIAARLKLCGVFVRNSGVWSRLRKVGQLAFDKTGTLTLPTPRLRNPERLNSLGSNERARLLQLVEDNRHPVARSLHEALLANREGGAARPAEVFEEPGFGVALVDGQGDEWSLGRAGWKSSGTHAGEGAVCLSRNQRLLAGFDFEEAARPDAKEELDALRHRFDDFVVLSGDRADRVRAVSRGLGFADDCVLGDLSPEGKSDWLREHGGERTLFIGDGANDSLGFDVALCSGMPASNQGLLESKADFCFLGRGLRALRELFDAADLRLRTMQRVFAFAWLYNAVAVAVCLAGAMNPLLAAILMPLSSVATIGIAARSARRRT